MTSTPEVPDYVARILWRFSYKTALRWQTFVSYLHSGAPVYLISVILMTIGVLHGNVSIASRVNLFEVTVAITLMASSFLVKTVMWKNQIQSKALQLAVELQLVFALGGFFGAEFLPLI